MPSDDVLRAIYDAIDQINRENPDRKPVAKSPSIALYGSASGLDSLGLINLVVALELIVERRFGIPITLADDRALSREHSPFSTVESLGGYIEELMAERKDV
jgi:acyl carrier protein